MRYPELAQQDVIVTYWFKVTRIDGVETFISIEAFDLATAWHEASQGISPREQREMESLTLLKGEPK